MPRAILILIPTAAATLGCPSSEPHFKETPSAASAIPAGWIATPPYDPRPVDGECVNFARVAWSVSLAADSSRIDISRVKGSDSPALDTVSVPGGRLVGFNHGEFGGEVAWVRANTTDTTTLHTGNLVTFARTGSRVLGLAGLAHGSLDTGYVLEFAPTVNGWTATHAMDLGEAPHAYTSLGGDSLLIVSGRTLRVVLVPAMNRVVHQSDEWPYTYPSSVVRDRAGVVYVGMRRAVARLTPTADAYLEDWLVPAECPRIDPARGIAECPCTSASSLVKPH